jgi:3-deoxy-7-phosphoheptulonate synthase
MIIVLKPGIAKRDEAAVLKEIRRLGYRPHVMRGVARTVIGAIGDELTHANLETLTAQFPRVVESVMPIQKRYKLVSREAHPSNSTVRVREHAIGGKKCHGRCSVESEKQLLASAEVVKVSATVWRAVRSRTSPRILRLGEKAWLLDKARGHRAWSSLNCFRAHVDLVSQYTDIIQIGARNAQNFQLLIAAAKTGKQILLKRGLSMRIEEWLLAGEYVLANENPNLMFCERGIRTFETYTRNTLDLSAIPIIKREAHSPVVIDPSQGVGRADLVTTMQSVVAMGADALLIEVHPNRQPGACAAAIGRI